MKTLWIAGGDRADPTLAAWIELRERVLRRPLGLTYSEEDLAAEQGDRHLVAFDGDFLIGGLIVREKGQDPGVWKIRQVAVDPSWQEKGIGRALMIAAEAAARETGITQLVLNSRETVGEFYKRLGYIAEGDRFYEVGIPHRRMRLCL